MIVSHNSDDDIVLHTIDGYIDLHNIGLCQHVIHLR